MSDEELNKKIEFIIDQQAHFAAQMENMREAQAAETAMRKEEDKKLSSALGGLIEIVGHLAQSLMRTEENVNSLAGNISRLTENVSRMEKAQARTDERLNIFINVVERFISGNGGAESPA